MNHVPVMKALLVALGAAALTLGGCQGAGGNVSVLQSSQFRVAPGSTYAWQPVRSPQTGDPRIDNDIIRHRIKEAVDENLAAKGYREVSDASSAQLLVSYHAALKNRTEYQADTMGGFGWGWGFYGAPVDIQEFNYVDGTLVVDIKNRASGELAWRATSRKRVDDASSSQGELDAMVADMMKSLPGTTPPHS